MSANADEGTATIHAVLPRRAALVRRAAARAASHLMGQVVRYDVGNVFNPAFTVTCRIARRWLQKR